MTERLIAGGGWSTLVAVLLIVAVLGFVLVATGKRDATGGGAGWKAWVGGAVVVIGLLFLLSRGVADLDYNACRDRSQMC